MKSWSAGPSAHGRIDAAGALRLMDLPWPEIESARRAVRPQEHRSVGGQRQSRQAAGRDAALRSFQPGRVVGSQARSGGASDTTAGQRTAAIAGRPVIAIDSRAATTYGWVCYEVRDVGVAPRNVHGFFVAIILLSGG